MHRRVFGGRPAEYAMVCLATTTCIWRTATCIWRPSTCIWRANVMYLATTTCIWRRKRVFGGLRLFGGSSHSAADVCKNCDVYSANRNLIDNNHCDFVFFQWFSYSRRLVFLGFSNILTSFLRFVILIPYYGLS